MTLDEIIENQKKLIEETKKEQINKLTNHFNEEKELMFKLSDGIENEFYIRRNDDNWDDPYTLATIKNLQEDYEEEYKKQNYGSSYIHSVINNYPRKDYLEFKIGKYKYIHISRFLSNVENGLEKFENSLINLRHDFDELKRREQNFIKAIYELRPILKKWEDTKEKGEKSE